MRSKPIVLFSLLWVAAPALAQAPPADAPAALDENADATAIFRPALLREGSYLIEAKGAIQRDPQRGFWKLIVEQADPKIPAHELRLMPCTRLSEMQRIVEASPNRQVMFQVTGPVFVFRNANYVLPSHAPVLMEQEPQAPPRPAASDSPPVAASSAQDIATPTAAGDAGSDSAEAIMRDLERAAGPLPRNPAPPPAAQGTSQSPPSGDAPTPPNPRRSVAANAAGSASTSAKLIQEETSLVERRGRIVRATSVAGGGGAGGDGGWMFVFDADANGLADPPMRMLPCLLLERIEDYARRRGNNSPALISGPVYIYAGQNYLLPTVFRIPQDRRNISP